MRSLRIFKPVFAGALIALFAQPILSQANKETVLLESRDWYVVFYPADHDGDPYCRAETENARGQELSLLRWEEITVLVVTDVSWEIDERDLEFNRAIGRSRWNRKGQGKDNEVCVRLDRDDDFPALLSDLRRANTARLSNKDGKDLAGFSLAGSSAAIGELSRCVETCVQTPSRDPFSNDPF